MIGLASEQGSTESESVYRTFFDTSSGLTAENLAGQSDFAKMRLREELATANYSNEAGIQVLLEADPQILKSIESMPEAKKMIERNVASN
jgi:hypothetical protein